MDFVVRQEPESLGSTGFVEVCPGRYSGRHWQQGCIFIWEDSFTVAEGILRAHFPDYDHLAMNDIPRTVGLLVVEDWRSAARDLVEATLDQSFEILKLEGWQRDYLKEELQERRTETSRMLLQLADKVSTYYKDEEWVSVLGV
jgi:hypothetical protein